jgi:hypothetical protein
MNKISILLLISIGMNSCDKNTVNAKYISSSDKSYFLFNRTSTWNYAHNFDSIIDTISYKSLFHSFYQSAPYVDSIEEYYILFKGEFLTSLQMDPNNFLLEKAGGAFVNKPFIDYQKVDSMLINGIKISDIRKYEDSNLKYNKIVIILNKCTMISI